MGFRQCQVKWDKWLSSSVAPRGKSNSNVKCSKSVTSHPVTGESYFIIVIPSIGPQLIHIHTCSTSGGKRFLKAFTQTFSLSTLTLMSEALSQMAPKLSRSSSESALSWKTVGVEACCELAPVRARQKCVSRAHNSPLASTLLNAKMRNGTHYSLVDLTDTRTRRPL